MKTPTFHCSKKVFRSGQNEIQKNLIKKYKNKFKVIKIQIRDKIQIGAKKISNKIFIVTLNFQTVAPLL